MSALTAIEKQLNEPKNIKGMMQLPMVQERFIKNYEAVTGKKDGQARFESEVFAFMEILNDKQDLAKADRFSIFAAIVKAGTTGLSFRDNRLYVMPGANNTVKVQSSPAGKREMMEMMSDVKKCPEPQVVLKGDKFVVDKLNNIIKEHSTTEKSATEATLDNIVCSYQRLFYKNGDIVDVIVPHADLLKARAKSKIKGDAGVWGDFPAEAAKKTATNRMFNKYHKYPQNVITYGADADKEDDTQETTYTEQQVVQQPSGDKVDTSSGEVVEEAKIVNDKDKSAEPFI